jgi:pyridoxine 5'-phosphate synthase PdxJ
MMVLSSLPDIEIACTDSSECFDDNKAYLHTRLDEEVNPKVKRVLKKDVEFLDQIQVEMATARQFLFIARCKAKKPEQVFQMANRVEKVISEQGFEVRRMKKEDIKRFLALYFDASFNGEQMPDIDGEQFFEVDEDDEDA